VLLLCVDWHGERGHLGFDSSSAVGTHRQKPLAGGFFVVGTKNSEMEALKGEGTWLSTSIPKF